MNLPCPCVYVSRARPSSITRSSLRPDTVAVRPPAPLLDPVTLPKLPTEPGVALRSDLPVTLLNDVGWR
jgi:hypothetical protein